MFKGNLEKKIKTNNTTVYADKKYLFNSDEWDRPRFLKMNQVNIYL